MGGSKTADYRLISPRRVETTPKGSRLVSGPVPHSVLPTKCRRLPARWSEKLPAEFEIPGNELPEYGKNPVSLHGSCPCNL